MHSFITQDRVFFSLELQFQANSVMADPDKYINIIAERYIIVRLGKDGLVQDWKLFANEWNIKTNKFMVLPVPQSKKIRSVLLRSNSGKCTCSRWVILSFWIRWAKSVPNDPVQLDKLLLNGGMTDILTGVIVKNDKHFNDYSLLTIH